MSRRTGSRTPSPYARAAVVVGVVMVIVAVLGIVLTRQDRGSVPADSNPSASSRAGEEDEPAAVAPNGPSSEAPGIPAGFSADEPGAVAAAVAYATASQRWLYLSDDQIDIDAGAAFVLHHAQRLFNRHGGAIGAIGGKGVVDIRSGDDPCFEADQRVIKAERITAAVELFVMGRRDHRHIAQHPDAAEDFAG